MGSPKAAVLVAGGVFVLVEPGAAVAVASGIGVVVACGVNVDVGACAASTFTVPCIAVP
jgi:hypothetical protein